MTIPATQVLRNEHEAILRMLEATEEVARRLTRGGHVAPVTLYDLIEFFQLFADRCHHGKEEDVLFPRLEALGMPRAGGPIEVMLGEHEQGRNLIQQMLAEAKAYADGAAEAGPRWAGAARSYAALLGEHIMRENNVLFPMAERLLSETEQQELAIAFERIEVGKMGAGTHQRLHAKMDKLLAEISKA
jgi:hemerythrin-like domain-containing protein